MTEIKHNNPKSITTRFSSQSETADDDDFQAVVSGTIEAHIHAYWKPSIQLELAISTLKRNAFDPVLTE